MIGTTFAQYEDRLFDALCVVGGGIGVLLALGAAEGLAKGLSGTVSNFAIEPATAGIGLLISVLLGLFAGVAPARAASRLRPVEALRAE